MRTLTGKEIELDIEPDYKVRFNHYSYIFTALTNPFGVITSGSGTDPNVQVSRIKERVEEKEGIPPVQQRLIFGGKQM